jgi:hypothetical protein
MSAAKKGRPNSVLPVGQPSLLDKGICCEVYPAPVPTNHPTLAEACKDTLVGQRVFVRGDYWIGAEQSEKSVLYECEVLR